MPRFDPPTRAESMPNAGMWSRFTSRVGVSVVRVGDFYTLLPGPTADELVGVEGTDWFLGGHVYYVSDEVGEHLITDGFEVDMDAGYGDGDFGDDEYGD